MKWAILLGFCMFLAPLPLFVQRAAATYLGVINYVRFFKPGHISVISDLPVRLNTKKISLLLQISTSVFN